MEGLPQLQLWEDILLVMSGRKREPREREFQEDLTYSWDKFIKEIDRVPKTLNEKTNYAKLVCLEDNDAIIKMIMKGRIR